MVRSRTWPMGSHWTCCGSTDFTSDCPIVRGPLGVVQIKNFLHLDEQRALLRAMLQRHTDDKGSIKTREGILGFARDGLTGAVVDSGVNVAMRASKLLRGLTNGATQGEDFKWANGHLYCFNSAGQLPHRDYGAQTTVSGAVVIVVHICRELQKLSLHDTSDAKLLKSLYSNHCTSILAESRNNDYFRKLSDEFSKCVRQGGFAFIDHYSGHDAAKSARVFLHYHGASMVSCSAEPVSKKGKVSDSAKRNESC